jgi:hypothetical protein
MLFAYASFALAFVLGITYVLLFKEIKAKHWASSRAAAVAADAGRDERARGDRGLAVPDLRPLVGGIWAAQIHTSPDPRAQAMSVADPKILVALLSWGLYSFALVARRAIGWSAPRRAPLRRRLRHRPAEPGPDRAASGPGATTSAMWPLCGRHQSSDRAGRTRECVDFARRGLESDRRAGRA